MRNHTKSMLGGLGAALLVAMLALTLALDGCKSKKDRKDIDRVKEKLKAMLKKPVDMHTARVDKVRAKLSKELSALLKKPDAKRRAALIKIIEGGDTLKARLLGDEIIAVNTSIDLWITDGKPAGVLVTNTGEQPLVAQLSLGCGAPPQRLPITVTMDDGKKKTKYVFKEANHLKVVFPPVPAKSKRLFIINTDKTWTPGTHDKRRLGVRFSAPLQPFLSDLIKNPDPKRRAKLLRAIVAGQVTDYMPLVEPYMGLMGVSPNAWTTGQGPAGLVVRNPGNKPYVPEFTLSCDAPASVLPITATFDDGTQKTRFTFRKGAARLESLPAVPAKSRRLFIITTDKTYATTADKKSRLGVNVTANIGKVLHTLLQGSTPRVWGKMAGAIMQGDTMDRMPLLEDSIVALGISPDRWTTDGMPAAVVINNKGAKAWKASLKLTVGAPKKSLPITATLDDGKKKIKVVFKKAESRTVPLPAVASHTRKLFLITTDKTWSLSEKDHRVLGVNISVPKGLEALPPSIPPNLIVPSKMRPGAPGAPGKAAPGVPQKGAPAKAASGAPGAPAAPGKAAPGVPPKGAPAKAAPTKGAPAKAAPAKAASKKKAPTRKR